MYYCNENNMTFFTDIEYIKIAICNTYGKDKLEWVNRLLWTETKTRDELWSLVDEADEPYQMRKALHALEDAEAGRPTGYTAGLDSTASGVQMFAIVSGCEQSARAVNLIGDGKRHDLYTAVGSKLGIEASRSELKDAVMTAFYESEAIPEELFGDDVGYFYQALERSLAGAWEVLELCKAAQACIGDSYTFKNPSGHDVLIRQTIKKDYKVESKTGYDWTRNFHFTQRRKEFGLKVNYKGEPNDRSIGANLAHTCDSWFANSVVDTCKHQFGFDVYHVFDQFFCSPKHMNRMRLVAREILAQLAETNYLQEAMRDITGDHTFIYTKRSNNLADKIRTADYFLS